MADLDPILALTQTQRFVLLRDIAALHGPEDATKDRFLCGAHTVEPVLCKHSWGRSEQTILTCTRIANHDDDHVDARCCWIPHPFPQDANVVLVPQEEQEDWRICRCGQAYTVCDTARLLIVAGLLPPAGRSILNDRAEVGPSNDDEPA